jgi:hypothetical protein
MQILKCLLFLLITPLSFAQDWSETFSFMGTGKFSDFNRKNPYNLEPPELFRTNLKGAGHAITYSVEPTGLLIPYELLKRNFKNTTGGVFQRVLIRSMHKISRIESESDFYQWLGLNPYEESDLNEIYPETNEYLKELPAGASLIQRHGISNLTFGCAACHTSSLFGKTIFGLTNRFPKANNLFVLAKNLISNVPLKGPLLKLTKSLTTEEKKVLTELIENVNWVVPKKPQHIGLDTSLAQVALSLNKRADDSYASKKKRPYSLLKKHPLEYNPADSKPAVWWNLKYKTRWLSDGSLVSANPILTNYLWNEIGRGTDLTVLEKWLESNKDFVKEITSAVFNTRPPKYFDFFPVSSLNSEKAKKGEALFINNCQKCHGEYQKNWSQPNSSTRFSNTEIFETAQVKYHKKTPVIDVGSDPYRWQGMHSMAYDLNKLAISKSNQILIRPTKGYVPPPLVGIWARWPYFHNNSIPNLCSLLTISSKRPKTFWTGRAINSNTDFDQACNGYPLGIKTPENWKKRKDFFFNTQMQGLGNSGHDEKILLTKEGKEKFTPEQKLDLIEFLKTL